MVKSDFAVNAVRKYRGDKEMYCGNCGKKVEEGLRYCSNCGTEINGVVQETIVEKDYNIQDTNNISVKKKSKGVWIALGIILFFTLIIAVGILWGNVSFSENPGTSGTLIPNEETQPPKLTAQDYFEKEISPYYENAPEEIKVEFKYVDGGCRYKTSSNKNIIMGYTIEDFNNDGDDDILLITLEKDEDKVDEEGYSNDCYVRDKIYLADDYGGFNEYYSAKTELQIYGEFQEYHKTKRSYATKQLEDDSWLYLYSYELEDDEALYDDPYYSADDSLGAYDILLNVNKITNANLARVFSASRDVSHLSGVPKAEGYDYDLDLKEGSDQDFWGGVHSMTYGDGYTEPAVKVEESGTCSSQTEICEKINEQLVAVELQAFNLEPFVWEKRKENNFDLSRSNLNRITFSTNVIKDDDESGACIIKIIK